MLEIVKLLIGFFVLVLGIPIGNLLARFTKEELKKNHRWFRLLIFICLIGGFLGLVFGSDVIMFSLFFIAIVTSRCLR